MLASSLPFNVRFLQFEHLPHEAARLPLLALQLLVRVDWPRPWRLRVCRLCCENSIVRFFQVTSIMRKHSL